MFSPLSRGYGSWDGPFLDPYSTNVDQNHLPTLEPESHRHGVTVGSLPRSVTSLSTRSNAHSHANAPLSARTRRPREIISDLHVPNSDGKLQMPKTYLTRKGALVLFTAPEVSEEKASADAQPTPNRVNRVKTLVDSSLKLGTLDRLAMSVLQYGDEEYDKENVSISDDKNKMFMKFLHKIENEEEVDSRSRPGSELGVYLRDLKVRSSSRFSGNTYIPRNREVLELEALLHGLQDGKWPMVYNNDSGFDSKSNSFYEQYNRPTSQQSPRAPSAPASSVSTPRSILSTSKLRASLKSYNTYLGRPAVHDERTPQVPKALSRRRLIVSPGGDTERSTPARSKRVAASLTGGSIVEEEEADRTYDDFNYDALTGMDGSSIYTDSTGLDKHMFLLDPSVVTGIIEEEEGVGNDIAFEGEGQRAEGQDDASCLTEQDVDEGGDWEQRAGNAANIEVEFASKALQGDETDVFDGQVAEESDNINQTEVVVPANNVSPTPVSQSAPHKITSPTSSRKSSPAPHSPTQRRVSTTSDRIQTRRKSSVTSVVARKTPSPSLGKTPSPVGIQSAQIPPSPVTSEKALVLDDGVKSVSPDPGKKTLPAVDALAKSPSPEMVRGKNTPPSVVIKKKSGDGKSPLATPTTPTPPAQVVEKTQSRKTPVQEAKPKPPSPMQKKSTTKSPSPKVVAPSPDKAPQKTNTALGDTHSKSVAPVSQPDASPQAEVAQSLKEVEHESKDEVAQVADDVASVASSVLKEQDIILPQEEENDGDGDDVAAETADPGSTIKGKTTEYEKPAVDNADKVSEKSKSVKDEMPVIPDFLKPKPQKPARGRAGLKTKKTPVRPAKKDVAKSISIASVQPEEPKEEKEIPQPMQFEHKKVDIPKEKEKSIIPDFVADAATRRTSESKKELEDQIRKMSEMLDSTLGAPVLESDTMDGLTEAELELAKQEMEEKLAQAKEKLDDMHEGKVLLESPLPAKSAPKAKTVKVKGKGSKKSTKPAEPSEKDIIKMQRDLEKQRQLQEKKELEAMIKEKQLDVEDQEKLTRDRELQIQLEMERLKQQEEEMQQAEEDVRGYLSETRKKQREEREARKKADQDRRKQLAKEKFEAEKKKREEQSKKAMEELERIHDLEIRRQKRLEEEIRREEEERLAQERDEEEERERMKQAEELEKKLREIEQEEEEKAIQRLIDEREMAARLRREKEEEREKLLAEEEEKRQAILQEQIKLEEEMRLKEEEEQRKRDAEKRRYQELKQMEEDARKKMQQELERRREVALARREQNLERRSNMDRLKQTQGITKAWVFSYFIRWPLESYNIPFGGAEPKNNRRVGKPKPSNQGSTK